MSPNPIITAAARAAATGIHAPGATLFVHLEVGRYGFTSEACTTPESAINEVARLARTGQMDKYRGTIILDPALGGTLLDLAEAARQQVAEEEAEEQQVAAEEAEYRRDQLSAPSFTAKDIVAMADACTGYGR